MIKLVPPTPEERVLKALYGINWPTEAPTSTKAILLDIAEKIDLLEQNYRALKSAFENMREQQVR